MTDGKRILILTADAGFGHRSAANAIAAALRESHGNDCVVEIVNPLEDDRVPAFLRHSQADYDRIVRDMPDLYKFGYEASDAAVPSMMVESALTAMLFEAMDDLVRRHQPDAIVTTYPLYQSPLSAVYTIRRRYIPLLTVVTDLATERAQSARRLGRSRAAYEVAEQVWAAAERGPCDRAGHHITVRSKLVELLSRFGIPVERQASL